MEKVPREAPALSGPELAEPAPDRNASTNEVPSPGEAEGFLVGDANESVRHLPELADALELQPPAARPLELQRRGHDAHGGDAQTGSAPPSVPSFRSARSLLANVAGAFSINTGRGDRSRPSVAAACPRMRPRNDNVAGNGRAATPPSR